MPGPVAPSPEEVASMLMHPNDSLVPNIIACASISLVASTTFIALRLWSRKIVRGKLRLDASDWLALTAWVIYLPYTAVLILVAQNGGGRHIVFVKDPRLLGILTIVDENLYTVVLALLKCSILSLYRQLFASSRTFYRCTWIVTAVVIEWLLQVLLSTNLQCIPISASWDVNIHGTCINYGVEALVAYLLDIGTDLAILSLPIPLVLRLNTSKARKRRLVISFAAGGGACIVSLVQLAYITKLGNSPDPSWTVVPNSLLGDVEILTGFLATSIATYRPLYRFIFKEAPGTSESSKPGPYDGAAKRDTGGVEVSIGTGDASRADSRTSRSRHGILVTEHVELTRNEASKRKDRWK
ncbi:hypothetical protein F4861DRAFT_497758 [Xylaria intraflava]|nr:hypothetical protein F4861DRAFT_497758 [Xylaria intraflava]